MRKIVARKYFERANLIAKTTQSIFTKFRAHITATSMMVMGYIKLKINK